MQRSKIYGICLERLSELIGNAKARLNGCKHRHQVILESYNTGDLDDIVYILDLYDLEERTYTGLVRELEFLASALSEVAGETLTFDYCEAGHLGLCLTVNGRGVHTGTLVGAHG